MDFSDNMYGEYGENNILEQLVNESPCTDYSMPENSGGIDILQQSLQAAEICGEDNFSLENLGIYNGAYGTAIKQNNDNLADQANTSNDISFSDSFDPSQFFNVDGQSSTPVQSLQSNQVQSSPHQIEVKSLPTIAENQSVNNTNQSNHCLQVSPSTLYLSVPNNQVQVVSTNQTPQPHNNNQNQYGIFKIQIPAAVSITPNVTTNQEKVQYVLTGKQPVTSIVNNIVIQRPVVASASSQVNTTSLPVVFQSGQTATPTSQRVVLPTPATYTQAVSVPTNVKSASSQPKILVNNQEEQTNKLAALLQSKAAQQSGSGNPAILKIGNQTINISNEKVAKALAANIIQQRLKQQSAPASQSNNVQSNATQSQGQPLLNLQSTQPQSANASSQATALTGVTLSDKTLFLNRSQPTQNALNTASVQTAPGFRNTNSPSLVQVTLPKTTTNSPINRIQIASVNIPINNNVKTANSSNTTKSSSFGSSIQTTNQSNIPPNTQMKSITPSTLQELNRQQQMQSQSPNVKLMAREQTSSPTPSTSTTNSTPQNISTNQGSNVAYITFQVDPNLTIQQVEQVQQIVSQKLHLSKVQNLTKEQKQLLAAFRAQLRTMNTPVQHYYLRNPQLFFQKVYQQLQTGKPFVLQVKVDKSRLPANLVTTGVTTVSPTVTDQGKEEHPTISLSNSAPRSNSPKPKLKRPLTPANIQIKSLKRPVTEKNEVMRLLPPLSPLKRPSLIMEQLQKNQDFVVSPDFATPFKSTRDAVRRLLPYHICHSAEVKGKDFDESEPLFDTISSRLVTKMNSMFAQYHKLLIKEASKVECSADVVLLQRSFLQNERSALLEMKQTIASDPSSISDFLSPEGREDNQSIVSLIENEADKRPRSISHETVIRASAPNIQKHSSYAKPPDESTKDVLLQQAVQSIL